MSTSHNGNDYERLKEELRGLKRRGAPWYFESALHQRLHGGARRRPRRRPIAVFPVLAVAVVTLCILGLSVYIVMIRTNMVFPARPVEGPPAAADSVLRAASGDAAHPRQAKNADAVKPSPRITTREGDKDHTPPDTGRTAPQVLHESRRDTAVAPKDTASAFKDTVHHGQDTSVSRNRTGRPD